MCPIVVTGFEPIDILQGIHLCVKQLEEGRAEVENQYARVGGRAGQPAGAGPDGRGVRGHRPALARHRRDPRERFRAQALLRRVGCRAAFRVGDQRRRRAAGANARAAGCFRDCSSRTSVRPSASGARPSGHWAPPWCRPRGPVPPTTGIDDHDDPHLRPDLSRTAQPLLTRRHGPWRRWTADAAVDRVGVHPRIRVAGVGDPPRQRRAGEAGRPDRLHDRQLRRAPAVLPRRGHRHPRGERHGERPGDERRPPTRAERGIHPRGRPAARDAGPRRRVDAGRGGGCGCACGDRRHQGGGQGARATVSSSTTCRRGCGRARRHHRAGQRAPGRPGRDQRRPGPPWHGDHGRARGDRVREHDRRATARRWPSPCSRSSRTASRSIACAT